MGFAVVRVNCWWRLPNSFTPTAKVSSRRRACGDRHDPLERFDDIIEALTDAAGHRSRCRRVPRRVGWGYSTALIKQPAGGCRCWWVGRPYRGPKPGNLVPAHAYRYARMHGVSRSQQLCGAASPPAQLRRRRSHRNCRKRAGSPFPASSRACRDRPARRRRVPAGIPEIKHDGFRILAHRRGRNAFLRKCHNFAEMRRRWLTVGARAANWTIDLDGGELTANDRASPGVFVRRADAVRSTHSRRASRESAAADRTTHRRALVPKKKMGIVPINRSFRCERLITIAVSAPIYDALMFKESFSPLQTF